MFDSKMDNSSIGRAKMRYRESLKRCLTDTWLKFYSSHVIHSVVVWHFSVKVHQSQNLKKRLSSRQNIKYLCKTLKKRVKSAIFVLFCTHNEYFIIKKWVSVAIRMRAIIMEMFSEENFWKFSSGKLWYIIYDLFHHFRWIYELKIKFISLDL